MDLSHWPTLLWAAPRSVSHFYGAARFLTPQHAFEVDQALSQVSKDTLTSTSPPDLEYLLEDFKNLRKFFVKCAKEATLFCFAVPEELSAWYDNTQTT